MRLPADVNEHRRDDMRLPADVNEHSRDDMGYHDR